MSLENSGSSTLPRLLSVPGLVSVAIFGAVVVVVSRVFGPENILREVVTELLASFGSTILLLALFGLLFRSGLERLLRGAPGGETLRAVRRTPERAAARLRPAGKRFRGFPGREARSDRRGYQGSDRRRDTPDAERDTGDSQNADRHQEGRGGRLMPWCAKCVYLPHQPRDRGSIEPRSPQALCVLALPLGGAYKTLCPSQPGPNSARESTMQKSWDPRPAAARSRVSRSATLILSLPLPLLTTSRSLP